MTTAGVPEILYARQPIYNRGLELAGFELLFRDRSGHNLVPGQFDGDIATSQVLVNAFTESNIDTVCSNRPAFVNFTADTLSRGVPFSPAKLVVEVLESVPPTRGVIRNIIGLRQAGYRIALDDYARDDARHPLLAYADIVKLEYPLFSSATLATTIVELRRAHPQLTILAEKIETVEDFESCREAGCDLFQGYFLARPEAVHGTPMPTSRISVIRLLDTLNDPKTDLHTITEVIRNDPFLSMRMLKLTNSALYYRAHEITSLRMALMTLGMARIRAYASLLALSKLEDKPHELQRLAATRGFICQELSGQLPNGPERGFTVGLFSCLDAFFDRFLADILKWIPLSRDITSAILEYKGTLGLILHSVIHHEQDRLDDIRWDELADIGIGPGQLISAFERGVSMANAQA